MNETEVGPEVYLDHAASAPLLPEAREAVLRALDAGPGNAGSAHGAGRRLRRLLGDAREEIARLVGADPREVVLTSGTTESNRLALRGLLAAAPAPRRKLVLSSTVHDGLAALAAAIEGEGVAVRTIPTGRSLHARPEELAAVAGTGTVLALPLVEPVTGALQPVGAVAAAAGAAVVHVDAAQAAGRVPFSLADTGAATLALSAHKIGGPQGVGALIIADGAPWSSPDGAVVQERGRRGGTEAVALACGFAAAARAAREQIDRRAAHAAALVHAAREVVARHHGEIVTTEPAAPGIALVRFPGCAGDRVLAALDARGIRVSTGTACASGARLPARALLAGGHGAQESAECVRISVGWDTTAQDVEALSVALDALLPRIADAALGREKKFT